MATSEETRALLASYPQVQQRLETLIGLRRVDPEDELHRDLVQDVYEMGPSADGATLQRMRYTFAWHLRENGEREAKARVDYANHIDRETVRHRMEGERSGEMARARANATDEAHQKHLAQEMAKARVSSMRKFLDAVESAIDLFRTQRADERKADWAHAQGHGGTA